MSRDTYAATPIMASPPSDKSLENVARKHNVSVAFVARNFLPDKEFEKWLKRHPEYSNSKALI